jgi:hypothetical protein
MNGKETLIHGHPDWSGSSALPLLHDAFETCLTVEDVENASGLRNVNKVPHHPSKFMGGDLNFVNERGEKILCVVFSTASQFEMFRSSLTKGVSTRSAEVGDEAYAGLSSSGQATQFLVLRKGGHAAFLIAPAPAGERKIRLTLSQLVAIGKIITARLV